VSGAEHLDGDDIKCYYPFGIVAFVEFYLWTCKEHTKHCPVFWRDNPFYLLEYELTDVQRGYTYNTPCSRTVYNYPSLCEGKMLHHRESVMLHFLSDTHLH